MQPQTIKSTTFYANQTTVQDLEPVSIWHYFCAISQIPRGSGNEAGLAAYIMQCAQEKGLSAYTEDVGNVIVKKPASSELYKQVPAVVIQSHMDMVCEKRKEIHHDFTKDPITFVREGNSLYADGTTLGADNGIGVATALAVMSSNNLVHGPLEFLFTVMEESGFDGAYAITPASFNGRMLINIDTEEEGSLYIGCAGSGTVIGTLPVTREPVQHDAVCYTIIIDNLRGGHSGIDIDKGRMTALQLASHLITAFDGMDIRLASLKGGNKVNALARDVEIVLALHRTDQQHFVARASMIRQQLLEMYKTAEPNLTIDIIEFAAQDVMVMARHDQATIFKLLSSIPHGVIAMSSVLPGLVETSTNLARITTDTHQVSFATMQRSLVSEKLQAITHQVAECMRTAGAQVVVDARGAEWQPSDASPLLQLARSTYAAKFGKEPIVKAIHAGLECGAFVKQVPGLDAISFGPTIIDAHSPSEHVLVDTVLPFWVLLTGMLQTIALQG